MATITRKSTARQMSAQKLAAQKAEEVAAVLHSFAATLTSLDASNPSRRPPRSTPRNWWRTQAGRFRDDPTFADFVAQVQDAREREN